MKHTGVESRLARLFLDDSNHPDQLAFVEAGRARAGMIQKKQPHNNSMRYVLDVLA